MSNRMAEEAAYFGAYAEGAASVQEDITTICAENAQLREQLATQSRILTEKTQQVESLRAELSEMGDAGVKKVLGLEGELEKAREALVACEEPLLTLIDHPVCEECLACKALEQAQRVLGSKEGA